MAAEDNMKKPRLAVVGASGAVGRKVLDVIEVRDFPFTSIDLLTSERSAGMWVSVRGERTQYKKLTKESFDGVDIAIFDVPDEVSAEYVPFARDAGCIAVDNSGAFRMYRNVPLVVPEINAYALKGHRGIVANPNCTTAITLMALAPLHDRFGIKQVKVTTFQAVSGAGQAGVDELERQVNEWKQGAELTTKAFPHPIFGNVIPQVGSFLPSGYTTEEEKLRREGAKILDLPELRISARCVRAPVFTAHSIDVMAVFEDRITAAEARACLEQARGIDVIDDPDQSEYPMPLNATGKYNCKVGGIRKDCAFDNAISLFVSGDQLLKGAALNAVQIAELLIK
jgi:aspartate-semialdehyde dehydrogenase